MQNINLFNWKFSNYKTEKNSFNDVNISVGIMNMNLNGCVWNIKFKETNLQGQESKIYLNQ